MSSAPRRIDQPVPGLYQLRLVKGGPWVAARIAYENGLWSAEIDGKPHGLPHADWAHADGVDRIWTGGRPIERSEYDYLLQRAAWVRAHQPTHPAANPEKPIDLLSTPIFGGRAR